MFQRFTRSYSFVFWVATMLLGLVGLGMLVSGAAHADESETAVMTQFSAGVSSPSASLSVPHAQFDDLACVLCHSDTEEEITFSSGESVSVQIDPDVIAHSVHGMTADQPLVCTDCHQPVNDYKFPHEPVDTIDYRGYQLEKAVSCERCHTAPHVNSHPQDDVETAVSCTDCHGSHDVQPQVDVQACADCHVQAEVGTVETAVLTNIIESGLFGQETNSDYCLACHSQPDLTMEFANGDIKSITVDATHLAESVHGTDNSWQALACNDCHAIDSFPHEAIKATTAREYSIEQHIVCQRCHEENYTKEMDNVHGEALASGTMEAAVCTDCHGSHDTPSPHEPRERSSLMCEQCHSEIFDEYAISIHGVALLEDGNEDVPGCIDCHGIHDINSPTTALARSRSPELCADCHADKELMTEYDISTDVFETYVADFHGKTVVLFEGDDPLAETNKAVCYDCHGVHNILSPDDPHAGIKDNLLVTCQQCHPDATQNFSDSWTSHFQPSLEHNPLVYLVNLFYKIVIPLTMGFFVFMIFTDIYRRVRQSRGK